MDMNIGVDNMHFKRNGSLTSAHNRIREEYNLLARPDAQ